MLTTEEGNMLLYVKHCPLPCQLIPFLW